MLYVLSLFQLVAGHGKTKNQSIIFHLHLKPQYKDVNGRNETGHFKSILHILYMKNINNDTYYNVITLTIPENDYVPGSVLVSQALAHSGLTMYKDEWR